MDDAWTKIRAVSEAEWSYTSVAGDFNVDYNGDMPSMPWQVREWYRTHDEAWMPARRFTEVDFDGAPMLDWEFSDRRASRQWGRYDCSWYPDISDHGLCPAVFLFG
jgi:hypothetical protein